MDMKFVCSQVELLLRILGFFQPDAAVTAKIAEQIVEFANTEREVEWLVDTAIARWPRWLGVPELRALYCTRFRPKDGVEMDCASTPGMTPQELEQKSLLEHENRKMLARPSVKALLSSGVIKGDETLDPQFTQDLLASATFRTLPPPTAEDRRIADAARYGCDSGPDTDALRKHREAKIDELQEKLIQLIQKAEERLDAEHPMPTIASIPDRPGGTIDEDEPK
jgi:hypothetical protein